MKVKNFLSNGVPDEALLPPPQLSLGAVHVPREVPLGIHKVPDTGFVKPRMKQSRMGAALFEIAGI